MILVGAAGGFDSRPPRFSVESVVCRRFVVPRKSSVVLYDGGDMERIAELKRAADRAERGDGSPLRSGDASPAAEARQVLRDFVAEAAERAEVWVVESIGHGEFRALLAAHPPRVDDEGEPVADDAAFGVNTETFPLALLTFVDDEDPEVRTITDPALEPDALRKRLKRLSAGEFDTLWVRAMSCNTAGVADPKAVIS